MSFSSVVDEKYFLLFGSIFGVFDVDCANFSFLKSHCGGLKSFFNVLALEWEILCGVALPCVKISNTMDSFVDLLLDQLVHVDEFSTFLFLTVWFFR